MEDINIDEMEDDGEFDQVLEGDSEKVDEAIEERVSDQAPNDAFAHIAVSQGLHIGREEHLVHAYVWTGNREGEDIRVGDYVRVPVGDNDHMFASVEALNYETEAINVSDLDDLALAGGSEIDQDRYPMLAVLDPITILSDDDNSDAGLSRRAVDTLPKPLEFVYQVDDRDYIYRGLNLPMDGIPVGYVSVGGQQVTDAAGDEIIYNLLDPKPGSPRDASIFRHMLVAGSTGKGKTQLSKNILRQFAGGPGTPKYEIEDENGIEREMEPATVIIDPENEYSELAKDPRLDEYGERLLNKYENEGFRVGGAEDVVAFVPEVEGADDLDTEADSTYHFSIPFDVVKGRPQLLLPFDAGAPTVNAINTVIKDYFNDIVGYDGSGSYSEFMSFVNESKERYVDNGNIHESSWGAMLNRIDKGYFDNIFDTGETSLHNIEQHMFKSGRVSVIPTDHIRGNAEKLVVMSILSHIVENKLKTAGASDEVKRTPIIVCVDEAHNYLSSRDDIQGRYIIEKFVQAAKQGRKEKLGLYMVTQNPADIDEEIRHQTNTKAYLGLEAETVEKINVPKGFKDRIPIFDRGQAVIKAPDVQGAEIQGLEIPLTLHKS